MSNTRTTTTTTQILSSIKRQISTSRRAHERLLTISRATKLLQQSKITPTELALYCHNLASYGDSQLGKKGYQKSRGANLNAFSELLPLETVLKQAMESEERIRNNKARSILDGVPISLKGNIAVKDCLLTAGSDMLLPDEAKATGGAYVCGYDSYVAKRLLRDCGAVLIGLTRMDEFGMGSLGLNAGNSRCHTAHGDDWMSKNPLPFVNKSYYPVDDGVHLNHLHTAGDAENAGLDHDEAWIQRIQSLDIHHTFPSSSSSHNHQHTNILSPGGSSSGSAISISTGSSLISIGTDTGGSVRLPSAWCGVVGFKPSYGVVSRYGLVPYASSLDTVGLIGPSVECCALVLDLLLHRKTSDQDGKDLLRFKDSTAVFYPYRESVSRGLVSSSIDIGTTHNNNNNTANNSNETNVNSSPTPLTHPLPTNPTPTNKLQNIKIGIPSAFSINECPTLVQNAWIHALETLRSHGATLQTVKSDVLSPSTIKDALPAYYVLACAEAGSNLAKYDGVRYGAGYAHGRGKDGDGNNGGSKEDTTRDSNPTLHTREQRYASLRAQKFGPEVVRRVLCGAAVSSSDRFETYYEAAEGVRERVALEFDKAFRSSFGLFPVDVDDGDGSGSCGSRREEGEKEEEGVDLMVIPTVLTPPPCLSRNNNDTSDANERNNRLDATEAFANDVMTIPISLAGLPSISVPVYTEDWISKLKVEEEKLRHIGGEQKKKKDGIGSESSGTYTHYGTMEEKEAEEFQGVVGIQIFGPKFSEETLFRAAHVLQR